MDNTSLNAWIRSSAFSAAFAFLALAVLVVVGEEVAPVKSWLKDTFYHHWLGKGALSLLFFAVLSVLFRTMGASKDLGRSIYIMTAAAVLSCAIMAGFFLLHTLHLI